MSGILRNNFAEITTTGDGKAKTKKNQLTAGIMQHVHIKHVQPRAPPDLSGNGHLGGAGLADTNRITRPDLIKLHVGIVIGPDDIAEVDRHLDIDHGLLGQIGRRDVAGYQTGVSGPEFRRRQKSNLEGQPAAGTDEVLTAGRIGRAHGRARRIGRLGHHLGLGNVGVGHATALHDGDVVLVEGEEVLHLEYRRGEILGDAAQILRLAGHGQDRTAVGIEVDAIAAFVDEFELLWGGGRAGVADVGHAVVVVVAAGGVLLQDRVGTGIVGVGPGTIPGGRQVVVSLALVADVPNAISVGVGLIGVGHEGTVVADVPDAVPVGIDLVDVGHAVAVVGVQDAIAVVVGIARIAQPVAVGIGLVGIVHRRTVVVGVGHVVPVHVGVADVSQPVGIEIGLILVGIVGTVVAHVLDGVVVAVQAGGVDGAGEGAGAAAARGSGGGVVPSRAQVAGVPDPVAVDVVLVGIPLAGAVVADVADAVEVVVGLVGVGDEGAVVAHVPEAVGVGILLVGVGIVGTVVADVLDGVPVGVGTVDEVGPRQRPGGSLALRNGGGVVQAGTQVGPVGRAVVVVVRVGNVHQRTDDGEGGIPRGSRFESLGIEVLP